MSDTEPMDSLMEMFIYEANQLTEKLEIILLDSEARQAISSENIHEIFRIMHTIKGSAAMMALKDIAHIAHILEDLFSYIREEKPEIPVTAVCDLVFRGLDEIRLQMGHLEEGGKLQEGENAGQIVAVLQAGVLAIKSNACHSLAGIAHSRQHRATVFLDEEDSMPGVRAFMVVNRAQDCLEQVTWFPDPLSEDAGTLQDLLNKGLVMRFSSSLPDEEIKALFEDIPGVKAVILAEGHEPAAVENPSPDEKGIPLTQGQADASCFDKEENKQNTRQSMISVNVHKLDKLIDIVGEIVISESMVVKSPDLNGLKLESFSKAARHLRKLTDELQDLVLSVRMVPVDICFSKMHRIVRDMSKKLDKEVFLEIIGEHTEVDKNIIDHLSDPMMHLIRNSMDHGIESRGERVRNNKPPTAKITLEAKNTGGDVIITISDDGRGLDREKILQKAKQNGLITRTEGLTDKEVYSFILLPGFSTKEQVTEFSGRGVGMDVVKQNIDQVRGKMYVDSQPGQGTVVTIKIPLTLAIIDGMLVKVGDRTYIIPTQSVIQSFRPAKGSVFMDPEGREMILVRGQCQGVIRLHRLFHVDTPITDLTDGIILVAEYNDKMVCLFADNLLGEQPVVVKSLPAYLSVFHVRQAGVGGCTILGDGSISMILDVSEIANTY